MSHLKMRIVMKQLGLILKVHLPINLVRFHIFQGFTRQRSRRIYRFSCTCHQLRMGMPCRHIVSVCCGNDTILGSSPQGFPLSSIQVFWWNQYYLYGMSERNKIIKRQRWPCLLEHVVRDSSSFSTLSEIHQSRLG
jgi:hypothetical protein